MVCPLYSTVRRSAEPVPMVVIVTDGFGRLGWVSPAQPLCCVSVLASAWHATLCTSTTSSTTFTEDLYAFL